MVSDLDGTLLGDHKEITPRALRAITALQRQGIGFTVCTGREYATLDAYASQISPNVPMICNNGAEVIRYPTGEVISRTGLPALPIAKLLTFCRQRGIDYCITTPREAYFMPGSSMVPFYRERWAEAQALGRPGLSVIPLAAEALLPQGSFNKFILRADLPQSAPAVEYIYRELPELTCTCSSREIMEVTPRGINKADGLRQLCRYLGLRPEQCCAIGDYDNDVELLQMAGLSVAMGNARPCALAAARYCTLSNEEDGVALMLEHLLHLVQHP